MNALRNLRWRPRWVSRMGCVRACLDYLGIHVSDPWLYGGTGHAFVINVHETVCASGPTAWRADVLDDLGRNLGYRSERTFGTRANGELETAREAAWNHARAAIAEGCPCYGWELLAPEFYVIYGTDESGYYYSGLDCETGTGPLPWRKLGDTTIGIIELVCIRAGEAAPPGRTVHDALSFALAHARSPGDAVPPGYRSGPDAFAAWIAALEGGTASDLGTRYNAGVWLECRRNAVGFLSEARERLPAGDEPLFDEALRHYAAVEANLSSVAHVYPLHAYVEDGHTLPVDERSRSAADSLRKARSAEIAGLHALELILDRL